MINQSVAARCRTCAAPATVVTIVTAAADAGALVDDKAPQRRSWSAATGGDRIASDP